MSRQDRSRILGNRAFDAIARGDVQAYHDCMAQIARIARGDV